MDIEQLSINSVRCVGNDGINKANSGHPGMVLGAASITYTLITKYLKATPKDSKWINRDRFVLASGHASMLLYMNLHLAGFDVSMDDIKNYRQLHAKTPGHPELNETDGVDATSGPLGQGISHAVGLAISEKFMAEQFNKDGYKIVDNYTYALCGDGDMEEGVTQEAISLAARLHLNKLIVLYDANSFTLDGGLDLSFIENVKARFSATSWKVYEVDGMDVASIAKALKKARKEEDGPSLIICKTIIGYGSASQNSCKAHGAPIGDDLANVKTKFGWDYPPFTIPQEVYDHYNDTFGKRGLKEYRKWKRLLREYKMTYPSDYDQYQNAINGTSVTKVKYPKYEVGTSEATRVTSGKIINFIAPQLKTFIGGASDVAKSVNTLMNNETTFGIDKMGRNIYFGVREFAMSCAQTGMLLYGGVRPYVGCFLVFSDYLKPSIRTAALMNVPSINIFTHDSIAVGEDGPTHEPIEQISSLRLIPNNIVIRPAGAIETTWAWRYALENKEGPVNIICSRQNIPAISDVNYDNFVKGAYIVKKENKEADMVIIATGSEVPLANDVAIELDKLGHDVRVVSMPSIELFEKQDANYKESILGTCRCKRVAIEMASTAIWYKYAAKVIGIDTFGLSGKPSDVMKHFGFTKEIIVEKLK